MHYSLLFITHIISIVTDYDSKARCLNDPSCLSYQPSTTPSIPPLAHANNDLPCYAYDTLLYHPLIRHATWRLPIDRMSNVECLPCMLASPNFLLPTSSHIRMHFYSPSIHIGSSVPQTPPGRGECCLLLVCLFVLQPHHHHKYHAVVLHCSVGTMYSFLFNLLLIASVVRCELRYISNIKPPLCDC